MTPSDGGTNVLAEVFYRVGYDDTMPAKANAEFIAACSPTSIASLLSEIDALRARVATLEASRGL